VSATITDAKVHAAADALTARGENPTQNAVRRELGGGSFATIGPALQQWRETREEDQALSTVPVPESIAERGQQLQAAIWQAAMQEAEQRLAAHHEDLEEQRSAAEAAVQESREAVETLEAEAATHLARIAELVKSLADRDQALARADSARAEAERKLASSEATASAKAEGLQARLDDAQRTIDQLMARIGDEPDRGKS